MTTKIKHPSSREDRRKLKDKYEKNKRKTRPNGGQTNGSDGKQIEGKSD